MGIYDVDSLKNYLDLMEEKEWLFKNNGGILIEKDPDILRKYIKDNNVTIGVVYQSDYHYLIVDLVHNGDYKYFLYERLIPFSKGTPSVMLTKYQNKFLLLYQFRHALRKYQYAFPRGFGTDNLNSEENAKKELLEEIGAKTKSIKYLGNIVVDSGISDKNVDVYECEIEHFELCPNYEGIMDIKLLDRYEFEEWIKNGKINDSFTLVAYSFYLMNME